MAVPSRTQLKAPVEVPLGELRQHPGNPRRISDVRLEHLQRTLTAERGMLGARPLIALPDGTVIAGNQRLAAAVALGLETIPVVYADLDDEQAARWMLLDNRGFGEDDPELLAAMLRDLDASGAELAGYLPEDVDAILRAAQPVSPQDPDAAPPLPAEARSVRGTVYELGPHRVMCGDATDQGHVEALVGTHRARIVLTDPPYGVDVQERDLEQAEVRGRRTDGKGVQNDDLTGDALAAFLRTAFEISLCATEPGAAWYVFALSGVDYRHPLNALVDLGVARHGLVWVKDRFVMGRADHHYRHENVIYGWSPGAPHHKLERRDLDSILEFARPSASPEHPTMKPVAMMVSLLGRSSHRGDIVLDPFAGSGSTLIAAEQTERRCLAMEIDPVYVDVIRQRYADYTDQPQYAP